MSRSTKLYKKLLIQRKSPRSLLNVYSRKIITSWEKLLSSSKENNAWGSHTDNGCYHGRLMDGPLNYNKYQRVFRKCFGCKIFQTKPNQHNNMKAFFHQAKLQEQDLFKLLVQILQVQSCIATRKEKKKDVNTFFHMQFNKGNPFIITARSNHRWLHKSIEETDCKKKIFWKNILEQCKNYVKASKWMKKINKSEILYHLPSIRYVKWKFSLSPAP